MFKEMLLNIYQILERSVLILLVILSLTVCHSSEKSSSKYGTSKTKTKTINIENFDKFYLRFHKDSIFQMSRIKFPLGGKQYDSGKVYNWSKNNWQMIKQPVYNVDTSEYKVVVNRNDSIVFERVYLPNSGFDFQCRFKLIRGKWFLVYCLDQNL